MELFAVNEAMLARVLQDQGIVIINGDRFGPSGLNLHVRHDVRGLGSVIVTQAPQADGEEWIHASLAWRAVIPTYDELAALHRGVFGRRRWAYQVFAPESDHVNIHRYALHLWGRADGTNALPDFGRLGTI